METSNTNINTNTLSQNENVDDILKYFSSPSNVLLFLILNGLINNTSYNTPSIIPTNNTIIIDTNDIITITPYNVFINDTNDTAYVCPITLEPFNTKSKIAKLCCGHYFEYDAIYRWLKYNNTKNCPCCRRDCNNIVERNNNEIKNFINNEAVSEDNNIFLFENPYSRLQNRDVIPHSYIYQYNL